MKRLKIKPLKYAMIGMMIEQEFNDKSTEDVTRKRIIVSCEANTIDSEVIALTARIADARDRRAKVEAALAGLAAVIDRRNRL